MPIVEPNMKETPERELAEVRFEWLLRQRGFKFWWGAELEKKLKPTGKRPDFLFETGEGVPVLAEIKSFKETQKCLPPGRGAGAVNPELLLGAMRKTVKKAAQQLEPFACLGIPMIVVLDNWRKIRIDLSEVGLSQLLGSSEGRFHLDSKTGIGQDFHWAHGADQILTPERRNYVSGVAVNHPTVPFFGEEDLYQERPMNLRILLNPFCTAPLPPNLFSDPEDEQIFPRGGPG